MNAMRFAFQSLISTLLMLLYSGFALAQSDAAEPTGWQLSLGLGAGVRTNPVMDNSNMPLVVIPQINYQGERLFVQNLDLGYQLWQDDRQQFSLLLTPSYDQIFFHRWQDATFISTLESTGFTKDTSSPTVEPVSHIINKRQLHERHMAALGGVEYNWQGDSLEFQLQALHELTNYYHGDEVRLALSKTIAMGRSDVKLTMGSNWQSTRSLDYFYGLDATEVPDQEYHPGDGFSLLMRFDWNYQLDEHWSLRFFTSYRHLSSSIVDSPLVTSNNVITTFAGGVYHF